MKHCRSLASFSRLTRWRFFAGLAALAFLEPCVFGASADGLRLLPPMPLSDGGLRLVVASVDERPLASDRAARISVLATSGISTPPGDWSPLADGGTLADGVLRFSQPPQVTANSDWFFVAHETALPPAVTVNNANELRAAVNGAVPGVRVLVAPGVYPGGYYFNDVRGEQGLPIVIAGLEPADPPVIQGGLNGIQFSNPAWLELADLVFVGATGNGLNIDDGGGFNTPARYITLRRIRVTDVGPEGNRDGIKLSGVADFRVEDCVVERWGTGGSAVDMVGCHRGVIEGSVFRHGPAAAAAGANAIQTKGGTSDIVIRRNRFEQAGARSLNIGGSTGLNLFRPPLVPGEEHAEARNIRVEGNTFIGSTAPVAFVGVDGAVVRFNTIYRPERWAVRILQETTAPGFVPCRNGVFTDNIVAFHSSQWFSGGVNIGANTAPETFEFARNWWYCVDDPAQSQPVLPTPETAGVYGQSPLFRDAANGNLRLRPESPASAYGADALPE
jgi:hypothetical protein